MKKTRVIIDFETEEQARAFFELFKNAKYERYSGFDLLLDAIPRGIKAEGIGSSKETKNTFKIKFV